jgi:hypothetical protein
MKSVFLTKDLFDVFEGSSLIPHKYYRKLSKLEETEKLFFFLSNKKNENKIRFFLLLNFFLEILMKSF